METRAHYVLVGSFVIGLLVAAMVFVLWISHFDFGTGAPLYNIYFEGSVSGLRENEDVRYHGIPIGKVKSIGVDPHNIDRVRVCVAITETRLMREDIIASVEAQGLTGYSYIQIQGGSQSSPSLKAKAPEPYPTIPSQRSRIDLLFANGPHVMASVHTLTEQLNKLFDEQNREEFRHFLKNIATLSQQLTQGKNSLQSLIYDSKTMLQQITQTIREVQKGIDINLKHFSYVTQDLREIFHQNGGNVQESLHQVPKTLKELKTVADHIKKLMSDFESDPIGLLSKSEDQGYQVP